MLKGYFKVLKNLNVCLIVNIGIKYDENSVLNEHVQQCIDNLIQRFTKSTDFNQLNAENFRSVVNRVFKTEFSHAFLVPNLVHYWSLDLNNLKLNIMKYLFYTHSLPNSHRLSELMTYNDERLLKLGLHYINIVQRSPSTIHYYFKVLQTYLYNSIVTFLISNNIQEVFYDCFLQFELEDLIKNIFLDELLNQTNFKWENDFLFNIMWACLIKLRLNFFELNRIPDPFQISNNLTPYFFLKLEGFSHLNRIYSYKSKSNLNELRLSFETCMRTFFKTVVDDTEKIDEDKSDQEEKDENGKENLKYYDANRFGERSMVESPLLGKNLLKPTASKRSNRDSSVSSLNEDLKKELTT
jgi:hypothetical protein